MVYLSSITGYRTTKDLRPEEISKYSLVPSLTAKTTIYSILAKTVEKKKLNFSRSALFHVKTRVCLKYYVNGCVCGQLFASNSLQPPLNFICLTIFVTVMPLTQF